VIVGKQGWLFYDDGSHLKFWRGARLTESELNSWVSNFSGRVASLRAKGALLYLLFPPYKETIYPERLPRWLRISQTTELDQILKKLKEAGLENRAIDVRKQILAAKATSDRLYFKYDTHWRSEAAYIAYRELLSRIHGDRPEFRDLPITAFPRRAQRENADLASMLGIGKLARQTLEYGESPDVEANITWLTDLHNSTAPHIVHTGSNNGKCLLLIKDSYGTLLLPFLVPHFERIVVSYVADGFYRQDLIDRFHPDVTVIESVENFSGIAF
jgi:alginate O-acetyltransferase complex protein AlgJ